MSALHLAQIKQHLLTAYVPHLDTSGAAQEHHRLSRAVAALALADASGLTPIVAAQSVTDHHLDGGIDGVAYAADRSTLILVQSKWAETRSGLAQGDVLKFLDGVVHIVNNDWTGFGGPLLDRRREISSLIAQTGTRIELIVATSSTASLAEPQQRALDGFCAQMNDSAELARAVYLNQSRIYDSIAASRHQRPDLSVTLRNWGSYSESQYVSYYGTASAQDVVGWYSQHGARLFSSNIRVALDSSDVNDEIAATARDDSSRFWFFNNGVTVVARAFEQAPAVNQKVGAFDFKQASVVNGAQTVSSLARAAVTSPGVISDADVFVRFVTVDDPDGEFARLVTKRTNTQNRVGPREFVSQDAEQARLSTEFAVAGHEYVFRTGESVTDTATGCDLTDATVAMACAYRIEEAVLAKREIGSLWDDITKAPYTALFNKLTTGSQVWASVVLMRNVEEELRRVREASYDGRDWLVLRHGNRILNWAIAERLGTASLRSSVAFQPAFPRETVARLVDELAPKLVRIISQEYPDSYPQPLFRNLTKCRVVGSRLVSMSTS